MPEVREIEYAHKELTELILKDQNIQSGHWAILIKFGFQAGNLGGDASPMNPALITTIQSIGIQRMDQPNPMTVDASELGSGHAPSGKGRKAKVSA